MFHKPDLMDKQHMQDIQKELGKAGSKEKTGFIEKEAKYIEKLENLQKEHLTTCIRLMTVGIVAFTIELIYAVFCVVYFGCLFGDCQNQLVCFIHYIKFFQCIYLVNTYWGNIQEQ